MTNINTNMQNNKDDDIKIPIDIEGIMNDIRCKIKAKKLAETMPSFKDIVQEKSSNEVINKEPDGENWDEFMELLHNMNTNYKVQYYTEFSGGKFSRFFGRIIRKIIKSVVYPITKKQTEYNAFTVRCMNTVRYFIENQRIINNEINNKNTLNSQKLLDEIANLKNENEELKNQIKDICNKMQRLLK